MSDGSLSHSGVRRTIRVWPLSRIPEILPACIWSRMASPVLGSEQARVVDVALEGSLSFLIETVPAQRRRPTKKKRAMRIHISGLFLECVARGLRGKYLEGGSWKMTGTLVAPFGGGEGILRKYLPGTEKESRRQLTVVLKVDGKNSDKRCDAGLSVNTGLAWFAVMPAQKSVTGTLAKASVDGESLEEERFRVPGLTGSYCLRWILNQYWFGFYLPPALCIG
jgi:hypothetical protein